MGLKLVLSAIVGIVCVTYMVACWLVIKAREHSLRVREPWSDERFVGGLPPYSADQYRDVAARIVRASLADALGIEATRIRPGDRFDQDYRVHMSHLFLDETDELVLHGVRQRAGTPIPPGITNWAT